MKAAVVVAVYWVVLFYSDGATAAIAIYSCGTTSLDLLSRNIIIIGRNMNAAQQTTQQSTKASKVGDDITHHTTIYLRKVAGQTESFAETFTSASHMASV